MTTPLSRYTEFSQIPSVPARPAATTHLGPPGVPHVTVNLNGIEPSRTAPGAARQAAGTLDTAVAPQEGPHKDNVNITSTAALLAQLEQSLAGQPAVDQSRVDALSRAISEGSYRVEPTRVAAGLVVSELALGQLPMVEI